MTANMQNPGLAPRASRDHFSQQSYSSFTARELQAQFLASRFSLPPSMAREVSRLCFGEGCND